MAEWKGICGSIITEQDWYGVLLPKATDYARTGRGSEDNHHAVRVCEQSSISLSLSEILMGAALITTACRTELDVIEG